MDKSTFYTIEEITGMSPRIIIYAIGGVIAALLLWFSTPFFTVSQNQAAIVTTFGKFSHIGTPGLNAIFPWIQSYELYPTDLQQITSFEISPKLINTYSKDNQEVDVSWSLFYRLPIDKIPYIYESNRDYKGKIPSLVTDRFKVGFGHVLVQDVADNRGQIRDDIFTVLKKDAASLGIQVVDFQLPNLEYGDTFREAINKAAVQKANIERLEYERQQAEKIALTAKIDAEGKANAVKAKADGDAYSIKANADADAHRVQVAGAAEATAIKAKSEALAQSPNLIELTKAQQWNGQLPGTMLSSVMPLMNVDQQH